MFFILDVTLGTILKFYFKETENLHTISIIYIYIVNIMFVMYNKLIRIPFFVIVNK